MNDHTARPGLISVIMPCYNAASYVAEAIDSVMGQTRDEVELIVVDDGSTDGSPDIVRALEQRHPGRIRQLFTSRLGPYPARNHGLRAARGEYIAFLDADDWWLPETLEKLHLALTGTGADLAYCGWRNVGEAVDFAPYLPPDYAREGLVESFLRGCPWPIHAALVKRAVVARIGGFSERRFASMDYDFWLRVLAHTQRITRVAEVLAFYRWHGQGQISAVKWRQVLDALAAQKAFIAANPGLVAHIPLKRQQDMTEGQVLRQAYRAFWKRDLPSAQRLFRHAAARLNFAPRDLRHIVVSLFPLSIYRVIVELAERRRPS